jgi:hypothetical protein
MAGELYEALLKPLSKAIKDPAYRGKFFQDPNGTLKEEGVQIGNAQVSLDWVTSSNTLVVNVANGGADWNGAMQINIKK